MNLLSIFIYITPPIKDRGIGDIIFIIIGLIVIYAFKYWWKRSNKK